VEFIADGREGLRADRFYFMEMNTRLQVEHPVTEAITGLDLVELQFRAASGETLPFAQADLTIDGHAVEARVYAEDPEKEFLPSTGKLWALEFPEGEGIRIDTGVQAHDEVTPYYDPMIAKIIAHGATRDEALTKLADALGKTVVAGPKTNVAFLKKLCEADGFRAGHFDTGFIDRNLKELGAVIKHHNPGAIAAGVAELLDRQEQSLHPTAFRASRNGSVKWVPDPWASADGFQLGVERRSGLKVIADGEAVEVGLQWRSGTREISIPALDYTGRPEVDWDDDFQKRIFERGKGRVIAAGNEFLVLHEGRQTRVSFHDPFDVDLEHMDQGGSVKAPMHGKLIAVFVKAGDKVEKGQRLAIVEAMKMEHVLVAPADGEVAEIAAEPGAQVAEGARLIGLKEIGE
jgi:3-methylcrotonyl-CoA carboxylase alpha subunit